ncbi:MAG: helix-turn-helix domain-containing protein [Coriobacteriaceae bacterium]|jgi:DNA-binding XRE family transcriptional regulator|nr:helix-turn-helix domain-containing protein [Coriobacteriaceae bacterium]
MESLGNAIRFIDREIAGHLREKSMTQAALASLLGMSENTLCWKRRGTSEWRMSEVVELADMIGFSLDEAIGRKEEPWQ